jgi:hypothetical protein
VKLTELARALGQRGGRARAARLPSDERRRIAAVGGRARRLSLEAAKRITDNLRYAAAARALREPPRVERLSTFEDRLPQIDSVKS